MNLLYIIPKMTHGGGMTDVLAEVREFRKKQFDMTASVVVLEKSLSHHLIVQAYEMGLKVFIEPSEHILSKLIAKASLVIVKYWNSPAIYSFFRSLATLKLDLRLCISPQVNGLTTPQIIPSWIYKIADLFVKIHPNTPIHKLRQGVNNLTIQSFLDLPRDIVFKKSKRIDQFRLFYAGTLNMFKTHPELIQVNESLAISNYEFDIWGAGMDSAFEKQLLGCQNVFYRGFSNNILNTIQDYHILCNLQTEYTYASFDKIMKECQWFGKPVVVLKNTFVDSFIIDGVNGLLANDMEEYKYLIENLASDIDLYHSLSEKTFEFTHHNDTQDRKVLDLFEAYGNVISSMPKKQINPEDCPVSEWEAFLENIGFSYIQAQTAMENMPILKLKFLLNCEGGLVHFLKLFPENSNLRSFANSVAQIIEMTH